MINKTYLPVKDAMYPPEEGNYFLLRDVWCFVGEDGILFVNKKPLAIRAKGPAEIIQRTFEGLDKLALRKLEYMYYKVGE